jgi:GAF domain-containing protein
MSSRRAAPSAPPTPNRARSSAEAPTRDALLAALAERERELAEAREHRAAMAEVLEVINASSGDLGPVFDSIVRKGARLCDATNSNLWLVEDGTARLVATPIRDPRSSYIETVPAAELLGRDAQDRPFLHIADIKTTKAYQKGVPLIVGAVEIGVRTVLIMPLVDDGRIVGVFTLDRNDVRPFTDRQIALARAFAGQALIAMKNARLLNETQEALERQTASSEILRVISQSPTDARPVFERIVLTAVRVLKCDLAAALLRDGDTYSVAASANVQGLLTDFVPAYPIPIDPNANFISRAMVGKTTLHLPDWSLIDVPPHERVIQNLVGAKSSLYLPLLREDECIGVLSLVGTRPNSFGPKEIAQAESFRDQALIAIENARLFRETQEALEQQKASAEVLGAISKSVADTAPVFETILDACQRLFGGEEIGVYTIGDDQMVRAAAWRGPRAAEALRDVTPVGESVTGRLIRERRMHHIPDLAAEPGLSATVRERAVRLGSASLLYAPMLWEDRGLGSILVVRSPPRPFSQREHALLQSFADQAAMAIQNARLFHETQEALEQQKASAEVLGAISKSVADTAPVFETILDACQRLFGSEEISIYTIGDDEMVRATAWRGARAELASRDVTPIGESVTGRLIRERRVHHIPDLAAESGLSETVRERARRLGSASLLYAPMLWEDGGIGSILVLRSPPRPFSEREQALLQTFADQAAIAIQNVRLFNETKEALERQTATANVLKVISQSVSDAAPVFETIIESCQRLFGLDAVAIYLIEGDLVRGVAQRGWPAGDWGKDAMPLAGSSTGLAIAERRAVHFPDLAEKPNLPERHKVMLREAGGMTVLYAPMLSEDTGVGSIVVSRKPAKPFSDKEIALVQSFADQAAIAIQNARMFEEVQARTRDLTEALEQQTATAEVLKVISRSVLDLDSVLQTLIDTAVRLARGSRGTIFIRRGDVLVASAFNGNVSAPLREYLVATTWPIDGDTFPALAAREGRVVHVPDLSKLEDETTQEVRKRAAYGAGLWVPLIGERQTIGVFGVPREEPVAFTEREIEIVKTFADQAVIAIENARLFGEVQAKTRDIEEALAQQTATADVLKVIIRSAFNLDLAASTILEAAARLCRAPLATLHLRDGDVCRLATQFGLPETFERDARQNPIPVRYPLHAQRAAQAGEFAHFTDAWTDPDYLYTATARLGGYRAIVVIPLMREGELVGIFSLGRPQPEPFTESQIKLTQTFADQAAIAIENARLFEEVQEALQREMASSEILRVISRSPTDARPVFDAIVLAAVRSLRCEMAFVQLRDGDEVVVASGANAEGPILELPGRMPLDPAHNFPARAILSGETLHVPDWAVADLPEHEKNIRTIFGLNSALWLPLMRESECVGVIGAGGTRPNLFGPKEITQAESFRDQAMIAIENARLFNEVQAKTRDLTEALQQQTATAEVLKVISRSAFDLDAVLNSLTKSAVELCNSTYGVISLYRNGVLKFMAQTGCTPEFAELLWNHPAALDRKSTTGRAGLLRAVVHVPDVTKDEEYDYHGGEIIGNYRSMMGVPLLRNGELEGVFTLMREEPGTFTPRQVELVQTFADQAVIAIENVRLFDEVQARTRDLSEALRFQTATSEVLKAISRSPNSLQPVLDVIVETSRNLCSAQESAVFMLDRGIYRLAADSGLEDSFREFLHANPIALEQRGSSTARAAREMRTVHIPDIARDPEYGVGPMARGGPRALLSVPLIRKGTPVGVITLLQPDVTPFSARQIEVVETFADQAIIAIENTRLFEEVQARTRDLTEALQMQTATSDVLKVISRSAFDLQAVFNTLVTSAVELSGALTGTICVRDGDAFRYRDTIGAEHTSALARYLRDHPATPGRSTIAGRVLLSGKVERIPDCLADPEYVVPMGSLASNVRSLLGVPLLRKEGVEGAIILTRDEPGDFSDRQVEIVQTFADQAVIALENVRLFDEVQARTKELAASLDDLRKAQDRLIQSEKLASLGQLTAGIAHEIKNPLNFINNFSALSRELMDELRDVLNKARLDGADRDEAGELIGMIDANLDKVVSHGKRADSIVKNMLLHSREGSGERGSVNVNAMVEEALNLAYHGARAEKPGFNVTIVKSLDENAGAAELYGQEMTRVLLNLISNGFYATTKHGKGQENGVYEPTVEASTRDLGHSVEIAIRDNGTGIPDEVKAKMFNPFFTTKPAGEGTGLGLSLSHDIVVKQHGGTIEVTTQPGAFTQFTLVLPRGKAAA